VPVACDAQGNIDLADLKARPRRTPGISPRSWSPTQHARRFETSIKDICALIHEHGGQVYMDGANMNAQVGLTRPATSVPTSAISISTRRLHPARRRRPRRGPIGVAAHLAKFLPGHVVVKPSHLTPDTSHLGAVSAAPYGSASILLISWLYIRMMGGAGLTDATKIAILTPNYIAKRLENYFPCSTRARADSSPTSASSSFVRGRSTASKSEDVAKRLMDYGYHAPTMSFPVPGTS